MQQNKDSYEDDLLACINPDAVSKMVVVLEGNMSLLISQL